MSKDVFTNKEQLCQSFWQSVKEQKFKAKKIEGGGQFDPTSRLLGLTIKCMGILQEPLSNFTYLRSELILKRFPFAIRGERYLTLCLLIFNFLIHCLPFHASYVNFFWVNNTLYFFFSFNFVVLLLSIFFVILWLVPIYYL